jgi:MFS family permease
MMMPSSIAVAILISRYGRYKWALWIGWIITVTATGLMAMFKTNTKTGVWIGILIVLGLGHGFLFNGLLITAQAVAPPKHAAEAAALYTFVRTVGFSFGVVLGGTTFQNMMKSRLKADGLPTSIATNAEAFVGVLLSLPHGKYRDSLLDAYSHGLDGVFTVFAGIGGLSLIATLFIAHVSMDRPLESAHVLRSKK